MSNKGFVKIYDWMYQLDLNIWEINIFALVYSMTESLGGCQGQKYICEKLNLSPRCVTRSLMRLQEAGLIEVENGKHCFAPNKYFSVASERPNGQSDRTVRATPRVASEKHNALRQSDTTSLYKDKNIYKNIHKNTYSEILETLTKLSIPVSDEMVQSVNGFIEHRKKIKKPMTRRALEMNLRKATDLSGGDPSEVVKLLDLAVEKGWQGIYPQRKEINFEQESDEDFFSEDD